MVGCVVDHCFEIDTFRVLACHHTRIWFGSTLPPVDTSPTTRCTRPNEGGTSECLACCTPRYSAPPPRAR